jgi:hypothetical protein
VMTNVEHVMTNVEDVMCVTAVGQMWKMWWECVAAVDWIILSIAWMLLVEGRCNLKLYHCQLKIWLVVNMFPTLCTGTSIFQFERTTDFSQLLLLCQPSAEASFQAVVTTCTCSFKKTYFLWCIFWTLQSIIVIRSLRWFICFCVFQFHSIE